MVVITKVESKIEINAPPSRVWEALRDRDLQFKWNFTLRDMKEVEPDNFSVKSTVGDYTMHITELIENERLSGDVEHPDFNAYGYILKDKGDVTELSYWLDYTVVEHEEILKRSQYYLLNMIKNFVEFLEEGGELEEFDPKQMLAKPL